MESLPDEREGRDGGGVEESKRDKAAEFEYSLGDDSLFERTLVKTVHSRF